jgi:hypothetical protein
MGRPSGHPTIHLQILEAEAMLARGDHIVEEMGREARERRKAGARGRADPLKARSASFTAPSRVLQLGLLCRS